MKFATEKIDLARIQFTPELLRCVPAAVARRLELLPVFRHGDCLIVAVGGATPDATVIGKAFGALCSGDSQVRQLQVVVADAWLLGYYIHKLYADADDPAA